MLGEIELFIVEYDQIFLSRNEKYFHPILSFNCSRVSLFHKKYGESLTAFTIRDLENQQNCDAKNHGVRPNEMYFTRDFSRPGFIEWPEAKDEKGPEWYAKYILVKCVRKNYKTTWMLTG